MEHQQINAYRNADTRELDKDTKSEKENDRRRREEERMIRRFLLLRCPGSGYGGGLALTAASLGEGDLRGWLREGRRGTIISQHPQRAGPIRTEPTLGDGGGYV